MIFLSIVAFVVIFSILVLVHEWGHFFAARRCGVKVEEFGLGLPPKAKTLFRDKKKTEYTLNWLPLGGFVKMKGEDSFDPKLAKEKDSFSAKKVWQRVVIVTAGVAMNAVLGFVLLAVVLMSGQSYFVETGKTDDFLKTNSSAVLVNEEFFGMLVEEILPDTPAAAAEDLQKYDFISAVAGEEFATPSEFSEILGEHAGEPVELSLIRRQLHLTTIVTPDSDGKIGVAITGPLTSVTAKYPPLDAIAQAGSDGVDLTKKIVVGVGSLFGNLLTGSMPEDIGGPVAIAKETFYRASSLTALLSFAAMLSFTLAIFNILPIPALDGGRLLFLIFEGITRRRVTPKVEAYIHATGYILLLGLILLITFKDIFL